MMDNTQLLIFLFIVLLGFVYLESILFFKVIKYLVEKIVLIKTFAAGLPIQKDEKLAGMPYVPVYPDDDFGEGEIATEEEPEDEFSEDLKPGDELSEAGV